MNARVLDFRQVSTMQRCPWCDARINDAPQAEIRRWRREHLKCREIAHEAGFFVEFRRARHRG